MTSLFENCTNLTSLKDLENWDTKSLTDAPTMFKGCTSLTSLEGLENWNVESLESMHMMFYECTSLTSIEALRNWKTGRADRMSCIFYSTGITSLEPLRNWDTSNAIFMNEMFYNCTSLTSLEGLENWDTSNVTQMYRMFENCTSLTSTKGLENWNTSNVKGFGNMFSRCYSLISATFGKNFSTDGLTSDTGTSLMFDYCHRLRYIDFFASDDTNAITSVDRTSNALMFSHIPATTVIYLPHGSQTVTDQQNVVYSYGGNENDLRCPEYFSKDKDWIQTGPGNQENSYIDIEFPRDFKTNKAIYTRTMSNNYGSVILPYAFTTNDNVQAYTLDEEHTETMYFRDTQTVPAHTPFAFKKLGDADFTMTDDTGNFGITVKATHTTHPEETGWDGNKGTPYTTATNLGGWTAKGYYVNQTVENTDPLYSDLHYIAGEKFYKANGETLTFPPHRVTFHGTWKKGNPSAGAKSFVFAASDDEVITAIEEAETRQTLRDAAAIYDLAGRHQHEAQKGLNIVRMSDGSVRKVFIK